MSTDISAAPPLLAIGIIASTTIISTIFRACRSMPSIGPGVHHLVYHHDPHCKFYDRERLTDCNCNPMITLHVEPVRS